MGILHKRWNLRSGFLLSALPFFLSGSEMVGGVVCYSKYDSHDNRKGCVSNFTADVPSAYLLMF